MDGRRFDRWTRRRFGRVTAGAGAALLGQPPLGGATKKRRKRCKRLGSACVPGGKRKCCGDLRCARINVLGATEACCKTEGKSCGVDAECCVNHFCEGSPTTCVFYPPPSDRALKANFGSVDPADMLQRVRALPITTWNYTADDSSVRHIGPMAQDFAAAFGVGADDRHIHPIDGQGVALAAVQGLLLEVERLRAEHGEVAARVAALETKGRLRGG